VLARLSPEDRRLALEQGSCPVLNTRLGAMGVPVKITLQGQPVFLCCKGCLKKARANPRATLDKVAELKARTKAGSFQAAPTPALVSTASRGVEGRVRANLARLSPEDRRLAEAQRYCPVQTENRLGSMGVPVKVVIKGRPVFLCCQGCKDDALENPNQTLAQVEKLKARPGPHPE
jgi:hypothetical protein